MRKCSLENVNLLFERISENATLYLPVDDENGAARYKKWEKGVCQSNAVNTENSPKDLFFPQVENLMEFKTEGKNIEISDCREIGEKFVVFGVRACDVKSFEILDRVFLQEPIDSYYAERRKNGIIVSEACSKPSETCFCKVFGIDPSEPAADISTWKNDSEMFLKANTEKGSALLRSISDLTEECDENAADDVKSQINTVVEKLPLNKLSTEAFGGGKTKELFDLPVWDELSQSCIGCGTCTFVCPTCQCYDIKDFNTGKGVIRYRCWDSCMYSDFTRMAHGNNRLTQKERFRQRFMHKLVYYPENNDGLFSCVGCGRCVAKCPISMNIAKVMKKIGGNKGE